MRLRLSAFVVLTLGVLTVLAGPGLANPDASWEIIASPNRGSLQNRLNAVSAVNADDAWAVGEWNPGVPPTVTGRRTLALHWDGTAWSRVRSRNADWDGVDLTTLENVAAVSAEEAWAVGHADDFASLRSTTVIQRWDGARWRFFPSPNPGGQDSPNRLFGIAARTSQDMWAVGEFGWYPPRGLVLRWNGQAWQTVPNPAPGRLNAVAIVSANEAWAVGGSHIIRWDGKSWQIVASPQPGDGYFMLEDVDGSSGESWAVGWLAQPYFEGYIYRALTLRWDGVEWAQIGGFTDGTFLFGVKVIGPGEAWAVGNHYGRPLILRWDGTAWRETPLPRIAGNLRGIAGGGLSRLWAVGERYKQDGAPRTLTLRLSP